MDIEELADKSDENFVMKVAPDLLKTPHSKELRSCNISENSESSEKRSTQYFPKIPLRYSRKKLNPKIMRAFVHCQATYKVSERDIEGILVEFANLVFNQD